jgi:alkanesulfonate monooxygenase
VEIIGAVTTQDLSETRGGGGPPIDLSYFRRIVRAHEHSGFDRALVALLSTMPEPMQVASVAA